jgi:hypothetical protein
VRGDEEWPADANFVPRYLIAKGARFLLGTHLEGASATGINVISIVL